jgi:large subunit ribosomal protein L10
MALTRAKKAEKVTQLAHELEGSTSAIIGTFAKLTVAQDYELRKTVRTAGGRYRVLKNKLAARASKGTQIEAALQGLKGVSSVAYTSGDPVALAKALSTWVGENAEFTFKLGIIDGKVITVEEVKQLATMPGKEEIFAKLLFLINSPAQRLATVINATGRDLAVVINQAVEQNKFSGGQAAVAEPAAAVVETAPAVEQAPASAVEQSAVVEAAAAVESTPVVEQSPTVEAAAVAEPAPVADAAPAVEPAAPEVSGGEEAAS